MAFTTGIQVLPGYPNQVGEKSQLVFDRTGPTSYVRYVTGTTPVGGDVIRASGGGLNWGGFDNVDDTVDTTGQINAVVVMDQAGSGNAVKQVTIKYYAGVTATLGGQSQTIGTEIAAGTNLSTFSFRFECYMV
jgi:hypothetical protein